MGLHRKCPGFRKRHAAAKCGVKAVESGSGPGSTGLPTELQTASVNRLRFVVFFYGFAFLAISSVYWVLALTGVTPRGFQTVDFVSIVAIVSSIAFSIYLKKYGLTPAKALRAGVIFQVLGAWGISAAELCGKSFAGPDSGIITGMSSVCVWIVIYPLVVPMPPRKAAVSALVSASVGPLSVVVWNAAGQISTQFTSALLFFTPNYVCAVLAVFASHVVYDMGKRMRAAQRMGAYELVELLGKGGMGEVWRARHEMLARDAAIKFVLPDKLAPGSGAGGEMLQKRFEREAQATAALHSAHSIDLYDFGVADDGTFYYVMELLDGIDLEQMINRFGPVPPARAAYLLRQICASLYDAHETGLTHRDIKPANLYLCRMGWEHDFMKVLDFGLVKLDDRVTGSDVRMTMENVTTGTPAYMAPELASGRGEYDHRVDIYALGCVAYHLLTGRLVFEADTPMNVMIRHLQDEPVAPSTLSELPVPRELDELILRCLAKDPEDRPRTAQELGRALAGLELRESWDEADAERWWDRHMGSTKSSEPRRVAGAAA